ncbi:MAG: putative chaperone CsaA [Chlamydiae bacterium]|nr:putative chaperone CsaA [Chlamydiota bacterium]
MTKEMKEVVSKEETFDPLEIRVGRIVQIEEEPSAPKKAYKLKIDFGKFGMKTSVGRFTQHAPEEILNKLVLAVLNFEPRKIGETTSEVLVLGVQYPKADSGEATFITPSAEAKIGGKLF